jgi:4-diphosphocytidyl-2-C-methyl-D-erythritol kinase
VRYKKMIRRARIKSLAKLNLGLRVLYKRGDGFHELRTVFQTISLADTIDIEYEPARRSELSLTDPLAIPNNLVLRAAEAALEAMRTTARVSFRLRKRIPMGGGLGGGSSNAAAVLLALPALAGRSIPLGRLTQLAASLGSDVPFFLLGGTALGIGRGAELYPLPELRREPILVVSPGLHVATGPAYQALALPDAAQGLTAAACSSRISDFQAFVSALGGTRSLGAASEFGANDFEAVVFRQHPQLKTIAQKLSKLGAAGARMTGSGSAIFAVFESRKDRDRARVALEQDRVFRQYWTEPAVMVNRRSFQKLWRRQLRDHLNDDQNIWPPQSRYAQ